MLENVMTSADAGETKTEGFHEVAEISKTDVLQMTIKKAT